MKNKIARSINTISVIIIILFGGIIGYIIGDIIIHQLTEVRLKDWSSCRIGMPLIGLSIGLWIGLSIGQSIEDYLLRNQDKTPL